MPFVFDDPTLGLRLANSLLVALGDLFLAWMLFAVLRVRAVGVRRFVLGFAIVHTVLSFFYISPSVLFHIGIAHNGEAQWYGTATTIDRWVAWSWLGTVAVLLAFRLRHAWRAHRLLAAFRILEIPADPALVAQVERISTKIGVSPPAVIGLDDSFATPFVLGWRQPLLVFPLALREVLSPAEIDAVLAHELAHIRSRDTRVNVVLEVVRTLFFFNLPLLRLISRYKQEVEKARDQDACRLHADPVALSTALVKVLDSFDRPLAAPTGSGISTFIVPRPKRVMERLRHLAWLQRRRPRVVLIALQIALAVFFLPWRTGLDSNSLEVRHEPGAKYGDRTSKLFFGVNMGTNPLSGRLAVIALDRIDPDWHEIAPSSNREASQSRR